MLKIDVTDYDIKSAIEKAVEKEVLSGLKWRSNLEKEINGLVSRAVICADISAIGPAVEESISKYITSNEFNEKIKSHVDLVVTKQIDSAFTNAFKGAVKSIAVSYGKRTADSVIASHPILEANVNPN